MRKQMLSDSFYELVVGEDGFITTLRCGNRFDEEMYSDIVEKLSALVQEWKHNEFISKKAVLAIVELVEYLAGGSRFLDKQTAIRVEDASLEIKDIINELYEAL